MKSPARYISRVLFLCLLVTGTLCTLRGFNAFTEPPRSQASVPAGSRTGGSSDEIEQLRELIVERMPDKASGAEAQHSPEGHGEADGFSGALAWSSTSGRPLSGNGSVRLAPAHSARYYAHSQVAHLEFLAYTIDFATGQLWPEAMEGEAINVVGGRWHMPVPTEDLLISEVTIEGTPFGVIAGHLIESGARTATAAVAPLPVGKLYAATIDSPGTDLPITVKWCHSMPLSSAAVFALAPESEMAEGDGGDLAPVAIRSAPLAPEYCTLIHDGATLPLSIPLAQYDRTFWVGSPGYQWEAFRWPVGMIAKTVELRPTGALELHLDVPNAGDSEYSCFLTYQSSSVAYWQGVRNGAILRAEGVGAGLHRVLVTRSTTAGDVFASEESVDIKPGEVSTVFTTLPSPPQNLGSMDLSVRPPREPVVEMDLASIKIWPLASTTGSFLDCAITPLREMSFVDGQLVSTADQLEPGTYLVGIWPIGVLQEITIIPGATAEVHFDLARLAEVEIQVLAPPAQIDDADPELLTAELRWRHLSAAAITSSRIRLASSSPSLASSRRSKDGWNIVCLPGQIEVVVLDSEGAPVGPVALQNVVPGKNVVIINTERRDRAMADIRVLGVPSHLAGSVRSALLSSSVFIAADGAPVQPSFVDAYSTTDLGLADGIGLRIVFPRQGTFTCRWDTVGLPISARDLPGAIDASWKGTVSTVIASD